MMVEARKDDDKEPAADNAARDLSRFAESSTRLFAEQAAVLAVMTAYGMSVAAQMTGMMLGSLRGPADASDVPAPEQKAESAETKPLATVVALRPRPTEVAEKASTPIAGAKKPEKIAKPVKAKTSPVKATASKAAPARKTARASTPVAESLKRPADGDDLKKISGVGPRLEQVLRERGIKRYADLAALNKAALKKLDGELGLEGRIVRDDWVGQAKALSGGKG